MSSVNNGLMPTFVEVNSLGIGFANISNLYKLDLNEDEYLVVGERNNPTNDPLDTKYNLIVNSDGVSVNTSRRIYNSIHSNMAKGAGLYVDNNIVCGGNISAKGLILNDITIANSINSNVLDSFIKQINNRFQPFDRGFNAFLETSTGSLTNVQNIYSTSYLTLGGFSDTFSNTHPLHIVETPNNSIDNIHICIKNDINNADEETQFRIGIIGGGAESPAIISTTDGMPLEFHVSISSSNINHLYASGDTTPLYTSNNLYHLPAMTIDAHRNVGIGTNITGEYTYNNITFVNQNITKNIVTERAKLQVTGLSVFKEIMAYDYFTNTYAHLDDIYVRSKGMTIHAGQIAGGIFNDYSYTFYYDLNVNQLFTAKTDAIVNNNLFVDNTINTNKLIVSGLATFGNDTIFNDNVYFQQDMIINKNLNIPSGDIFYGGKRLNVLNFQPVLVDASIASLSNLSDSNILIFAAKDVINVSGKNVAFPGKIGVGIEETDSYPEDLNIIKRNTTTFEIMMNDISDEYDPIGSAAFIGHLTELNEYDN
ncbi:hypothetical protein, partial [Flavobacterium sp.]|uniref:hypothetical protein n=1 Tax=Flavobacterium sp. TaxID=239 RepID=UPI0037C0CB3C